MYQAWRSGDLEWLEQNIAMPMRNDFPTAYQTLLVKRNNAWMGKIEAMAASDQTEFVVVGALHLAGADGLLEQLAARGYRVTQLH